MKDRCVFICLDFHEKTRSTDFFLTDLLSDFVVDRFSIETATPDILVEIVERGYKYAVCWQTEYLAPFLLSHGLKVICVPMWDAVVTLPNIYWLGLREARFVAFSMPLYHRLTELGLQVRYAQYFPDPWQWPAATFGGETRALFWCRRPRENLDWRFAARLVGKLADTLHVHDAPDHSADCNGIIKPEDFSITVSRWDQNATAYIAALEQSNLYIAPRHTEGIGMSFLEALGRGMCVIGPETSTFTDYVIDGWNGCVVNYHAPRNLGDLQPKRMGERARLVVGYGRDRWLKSLPGLRRYIRDCPAPQCMGVDQRDRNIFLEVAKRSVGSARNGLGLKWWAHASFARLAGRRNISLARQMRGLVIRRLYKG